MNHKNKLKYIFFKFALRLLDIFQQFTFVIKKNEQYTDLRISNINTKEAIGKTINIYCIYKRNQQYN